MPLVRIPTVLRKHTDGQAKLESRGGTVRQVFDDLTERYPELRDQLFDDGEIRGFINVYVEDEDIRYLDGLDSTVEDGDEVAIMPAVAGGAEPTAGVGWSERLGGAVGEHARRPRSAGGCQG